MTKKPLRPPPTFSAWWDWDSFKLTPTKTSLWEDFIASYLSYLFGTFSISSPGTHFIPPHTREIKLLHMLIEFYCFPFLHIISIPAQLIIPINPDSNLSSVFAGQQVRSKQNDSLLDCLLVLPPLLCWRFWQLGALSLLYIATQHVASKEDGRVTLSWRHLRQGTEMLSWAHLWGNLFNALPESSTIWFTM